MDDRGSNQPQWRALRGAEVVRTGAQTALKRQLAGGSVLLTRHPQRSHIARLVVGDHFAAITGDEGLESLLLHGNRNCADRAINEQGEKPVLLGW